MVRRVVLLLLFVAVVAPVHTQTARQDKFFDSQGVKIRYIDVGQGEPVVLIHGFSSDLDQSWGNPGTIDRLAADFRVVALDVRGHGKSDKPHDTASYGLPVVEDVTRLLDHLHIAKAHIVGYSMGGAITGKFIALHPDRTISAVFGGSAPRTGWTAQTEKDSEELATSLETGHGIRPLILRLSPPGEPPPSEETIAARSRATLGRNDALALAAVQRGNKAQVITLADVNGLKMPLLAIIGSADPIKAGVDAFKRVKPELEVVVLEGATHSGERGAPARPEFRDALHAFLAMHRATTSQAR
jgi:pimeloyl-ACP methyl ester carboxylesterase